MQGYEVIFVKVCLSLGGLYVFAGLDWTEIITIPCFPNACSCREKNKNQSGYWGINL